MYADRVNLNCLRPYPPGCRPTTRKPISSLLISTFPNEAEEIRKRGGILIRIERKGSGAGDHISETALDDYDKWNMVIFNDYDLDTLKEQAKTIVKCYHDYLYNS